MPAHFSQSPFDCSSWFLPRLVGISRAQDWMLSGRTFGGEEAFAGGLVRDLLPADDLLPAAQRLALGLTAGTSPVSVALARQLLWRMLAAEAPDAAHRMESRALASRAGAADVVEGVAAFMEKRPPNFPLAVSRDLPDLRWDAD
jgi:enoyl-CoA hydratase/carnithine racemase